MTTHELAKRLLEMKDVPVCVRDSVEYYHDDTATYEIRSVEDDTRSTYSMIGGYAHTDEPVVCLK